MPAPLNPNLWASVLHDEDGIPISGSNPLPVNANVVVSPTPPGTQIIDYTPVAVAAAGTQPLPAIPAGCRRRRVQVTGGDATTAVLIRAAGGAAGDGILLVNNGSTMYGGDGEGSLADLEAENIAGPGIVVRVQDEVD